MASHTHVEHRTLIHHHFLRKCKDGMYVLFYLLSNISNTVFVKNSVNQPNGSQFTFWIPKTPLSRREMQLV